MTRKKLLIPAILVLLLATAITISTASFTSSLSTVNNSGLDVTEFVSHHPLSGDALLSGNFTNTDTLNIAVVDGIDGETQVPSQPPSLQDDLDGVVADDGGVLTTETTETASAAINDMTLLPAIPAVDDAYYFGSDHPFRLLTLNTGTAGVGTWDITWEYYMTSGWIPLSNVDDRTDNFQVGGTQSISYDMPDDWLVQTVNAIVNKYWIRARVTAYTSVIAAPVGTQAQWETGAYIVFNDELVAGEQVANTLALGSTVDLVAGHQFFPGDAGYLVTDSATLENASDYLIRVAAYIETDFTNPATSSILEKTGAIRVYNPADGTIRLRLNGVTDLDITGVEDGYYIMDIYDDSVNVLFTIYEVGSATNATVAIPDNANDWEIGTEGAAIYYDHIFIGQPLVFNESTSTQFTAWTHTDTTEVATPGDGSLQLDGWDAFPLGSLCQSSRNPPAGWVFGFCGGGTQQVGSEICANVYGVGTCLDGSYVLRLETNQNFNQYASLKPIDDTPAIEGQVFSFGAYCNINETFTNSPIGGVSIEFLDVGLSQLSITHAKGDYLGPCGLQVWGEAKIENLAAPVNTAWVRFHLVAESPSRGKEVLYDEVRANIGATVVPNFEHVDNLLPNGSFEEIYPATGTGESIQLDPTSITSVTQSSIDWSEDIPIGTVLTVEASIDNGTIWVEVENSGDPIPGISVGDDLSGGSNFKVRAIMNSDVPGSLTPILEDITMLIIGTGAVLDGWWQPNELIGDTLSDRSGNSNDAVTSFPLPTDSHDFQFVTGAFAATGYSTVQDVTTGSQDVVPEIAEVNVVSSDTDFSYLPFYDLLVFMAGDDYPIQIVFSLMAGTLIILIGMLVMATMGSVGLAAAVMGILTLFATQMGTDGIIPFWVFAFAALSMLGVALWTHPKVSL